MTDEKIKQYTDEHWRYVTYCRECKYIKREWVAPGCRDWFCDQHRLSVTPEFWCAYGEKKGMTASENEITVVA